MSQVDTTGLTHFDQRRLLQPTPGLPRDFLDGRIVQPDHALLLADPDIRQLAQTDETPIPATADRENYYDDRHIEYWLSGMADARKLLRQRPEDGKLARYLDFGGATGRVARHMARHDGLDAWLCDINVNWIAWVDRYFAVPIRAFQNRIAPSLPIADGYFDLVSAFSVFTHLDHDEIPWLLELRRIVRSGGKIYTTILDENTWDRLRDPSWGWLLKSLSRGRHDDTLPEMCKEALRDRVVLEYSSAEAYNSNVFLPRAYVEKKWGSFFQAIHCFPDGHNFQTVVVLQCP